MRNGHCTYVFNPSELYQKTKPGQGVETTCGALTWPAQDEPEIAVRVVRQPGIAEVTYQYLHTGRFLPREQPDPYCPGHGGSPEPPPPPVTMSELEAAHAWYAELAGRYQAQEGGAITAPVPGPAQITASPPAAAADTAPLSGRAYQQLAEQARQAGVTSVG